MKNRKTKLVLGIALALFIVLSGCGGESDENEVIIDEAPTSSWEVIQSKIFEPNCVTCHTAGTSFAKQSDLTLTKDAAYNQLIDRKPKNTAAKADGLKLLETKGLESLSSSFLWEKINVPDQEHYYEEHPEYGEIMPLGIPSLTNGELAYIREWIIAGAPETGFVADESLLENTARFEVSDAPFEALPLPSSGVQMHLGPFEVPANHERELYEYKILDNTEDIYVNRIEIILRKGSHHFILNDFESGTSLPPANEIRDIRDNNNQFVASTISSLVNQIFVFGTQFRITNYNYPEGIALKVPAKKGFDMNIHYANYSNVAITGEAYVNLHAIDQSQVQHLAEELFLSEEDFSLPPKKETTVTANHTFAEKRNIFMLTSHAHKQMEEFRIFIKGGARDGELVYYTNDWEHPVLLEYDPPLVLNAGEGLRGEAIYNNQTDNTLRFGLLSLDEMMIIFGAYYTD